MKKTFKQFNIEKKSWDTYLEEKGYKKAKKKKDCGCQNEDLDHHADSASFLDYLMEATSFEQSWKQQGEKVLQRVKAEHSANPLDLDPTHMESEESLGKHFQDTVLKDLHPDHHAWVVTRYRKGGIPRLEDISSRTIPAINKFNDLKSRGETGQVKISHFPTLGRLEDYVEARSAGKKTSAERFSGADHHVEEENENWKVIIPKNEQAACKFGSGTRWCTASSEDNYFDHYSKMGPLRIMTPKAPAYKGEKYQWHAGTNQLMNEKDEPVTFGNVIHGHQPWETHNPNMEARSLPKISGAFAYAKEGIAGKDYPIDKSTGAMISNRQLQTLAHLDVHPDVKEYAFKHRLDRHEHLLTDVHFDEMAHSGTRDAYEFLREKRKLTPNRRGILLNNSGDLAYSDVADIIHTGDEKLPENSVTEYLTKLNRKIQDSISGQKSESSETNVSRSAIPHLLTSNSLTDHHISHMVRDNLVGGGDLAQALVAKEGLEKSHDDFGKNQKTVERLETINKAVPKIMNNSSSLFRDDFYREALTKKQNISALTDAVSAETLHKDYHHNVRLFDKDQDGGHDQSFMKGLMALVAGKQSHTILNSSIKDTESTPHEEVIDRLSKGHYDNPLLRSITDDFTNRLVHRIGSGTRLKQNVKSAADISYGLTKRNVSDIMSAATNAHTRLTDQYLSHSDNDKLDMFSADTFGDNHSHDTVRHLLKFSDVAKLTPEHGKALMGMLGERARMHGHDAKLDGDKPHFIDPSGHVNNLLTPHGTRDYIDQSSEIFRRTGIGRDEKYIGSLLDHPSTLMQSLAGNAAGSIGKKYMFKDPKIQERYNDVSPDLRQKILTHENPMVRLNYFSARVGGKNQLSSFSQGSHIGNPEGQHEILDHIHAVMSDPNPIIRDRFYTGARQLSKNILDRKPKFGRKFDPKDHATPEVLEKAQSLSNKVNEHGDTIMGHLRRAGLDVPDNNVHKDIIEMENFINKQ